MRQRDPRAIAAAALALYAIAIAALLAFALRGAAGGVAGALRAGMRPASAEAADRGSVIVTIAPGTGAAAIARQLVDAGVLEHTRPFHTLLAYGGGADALKAGRYDFQRGSPAVEVLRRLRAGATSDRLLAIPEGLRLEEIGALLAEHRIATAAQWNAALAAPRAERILAGRPRGASLLGYLAPVSYPLADLADADDVVRAMVAAFAEQAAPLLPAVQASGLSLHEVLTLASIVEREAVVADEQPLIAAVFLNRLRAGIALQADPTVQFAVATARGGVGGWWPELSVPDLAVDSPYNTYRTPGLPPGPIASPGVGAIDAVLRPAQTAHLYFVARCDGTRRHFFAATLAEHNANVARCPQ